MLPFFSHKTLSSYHGPDNQSNLCLFLGENTVRSFIMVSSFVSWHARTVKTFSLCPQLLMWGDWSQVQTGRVVIFIPAWHPDSRLKENPVVIWVSSSVREQEVCGRRWARIERARLPVIIRLLAITAQCRRCADRMASFPPAVWVKHSSLYKWSTNHQKQQWRCSSYLYQWSTRSKSQCEECFHGINIAFIRSCWVFVPGFLLLVTRWRSSVPCRQ